LLFALEKLRQKQAKETFRQYREQPGTLQVTTPSDIESLDQLRATLPA
jgi:hypothetical protein